jgi:hypothetical protein
MPQVIAVDVVLHEQLPVRPHLVALHGKLVKVRRFERAEFAEAGREDRFAALRGFLADLHSRLAPRHRVVAVTMPIDNADWSARRLADVADKVVLGTVEMRATATGRSALSFHVFRLDPPAN